MKFRFLFYFLFIIHTPNFGQSGFSLQEKQKEAFKMYREGRFKDCIKISESIIAENQKRFPFSKLLMCESYIQLHKPEKAKFYLKESVLSGLFSNYKEDSEWIIESETDSAEKRFFISQLTLNGEIWFKLYESSLSQDIAHWIDKLEYADQTFRKVYKQANCERVERANYLDSCNSVLLFDYIEKYGSPMLSNTGWANMFKFGLIYCHISSDGYNDDFEYKYYVNTYKPLINRDEIDAESYAAIIDNICWKRFDKQYYGTMNVENFGKIWPFINVDSVNYWRDEIGLKRLQLPDSLIQKR